MPNSTSRSSNTKRIVLRARPAAEREGFFVPPDYAGPGAALSLLPTRTYAVRGVSVLGDPEHISIRWGRLPNVLLLDIDDVVTQDIVLEIAFEGEPPALGKAEFSPGEDLDTLGKSHEQMFQERAKAVAGLSSATQDFFLDYERGTNLEAGQLPQDGRRDPIARLQTVLCARVILKARKWASGSYPRGTASDEVIQDVRSLSTLQLALYHDHFGGGASPVPSDLGGLRTAFEQFASGALRLSDGDLYLNAEPDSAWYFFFGEFALLAAHFGEDQDVRDFWHELGRTLAWTQEIYVHCYPPSEHPARFVHYAPQNHVGSAVTPGLQAAWVHYQSATLDDLHERTAMNARKAFPGEQGVTTMPI